MKSAAKIMQSTRIEAISSNIKRIIYNDVKATENSLQSASLLADSNDSKTGLERYDTIETYQQANYAPSRRLK
jgi:hypothetical protein